MRIEQEIMLGIGGYRAVECLGLQPTVYHMNEGHSAFLALERTRLLMEAHGLSFDEAREVASAGLVFTTHTPVAAGQDYFPADLMGRYFADYARTLGLDWKQFLALGRQNPDDEGESFCMTILALHLAAHSNGVSRLHGRVSRKMWQGIWPGVPEDEIPIGHVTNGIHIQSWTSMEMKELYDRYLGLRWREEPVDEAVWQRAAGISGEELWRTHERRRERMVTFARRRLHGQLERRGASMVEMQTADEVLDPKALTIGFGRRFATYKRATLLLRDPDRLAAILNSPEHPVQVVFAGKAHPRDDPGKELIRRIVALAREERFRRRLVFVEDYDMAVARYLVQGADVWLNTPLRPREASGTSGMKAAANGVLNLSTLDGWWDEAYQAEVGWAIGRGETYDNADYQDQVEAEALYELLERDVVPAFYERGADGLPRRWIARIKSSVGTLCHDFNTHRMVGEYTTRIYLPAGKRCRELAADGMARGKTLAAWKTRVQQSWPQVRVEAVESEPLRELDIRGQVLVRARIHLGTLGADDVSVELYLGRVDVNGEIVQAEAMPMLPRERDGQGNQRFEASIVPRTSGLHGFTVRVLAHHPDLVTRFVPGLIHWA
jgi:starch phosphorylase